MYDSKPCLQQNRRILFYLPPVRYIIEIDIRIINHNTQINKQKEAKSGGHDLGIIKISGNQLKARTQITIAGEEGMFLD